MATEGRHPVRDGTMILRVGLGGALFFALLVLAAWVMGVDPAPDPEGGGPAAALAGDNSRVDVLGDLGGGPLRESSGAAVSRAHDGIFWTHGDRAGPGTLFALRFDGAERGRVELEGVRGSDWEDVSLAACPGGAGGDCLWFADIGDNEAARESVSVYAVPEPGLVEGEASVRPVASVTFRYPDGPADAEAAAVLPDGRILIVTKGEDGTARLYELPAGAVRPLGGAGGQPDGGEPAAGGPPPGDQVVVAEPIGTLSIDVGRREDRITAAAVSPDGSTLALRSHVAIHLVELDRPLEAPVVCQLGRLQPQSEGMDFVDDSTFLLTSEAPRGEAPILRVRCP